MRAAIDNLTRDPVKLALGLAIVGGALWWLVRSGILAGARTAGGVLSGNNALTEGTPYQGAGAAGTLGAATNAVLGGVPRTIGEALSSGLFDLFRGSQVDSITAPTYIVTFPDGARHAVPSETVDSAGRFTRNGTRYQLTIDEAGKKWAFPT